MDPTAKFLIWWCVIGVVAIAISIGPRELMVMQAGARRKSGDWWLAGIILGMLAAILTWPFAVGMGLIAKKAAADRGRRGRADERRGP